MEGDESKSQSLHEDNQISVRLAETVRGFHNNVKEVIKTIEQDGNFSELTPESYHEQKSYVRKHLTELGRMHRALCDQFTHLIREVNTYCPTLLTSQPLDSSDSSSPQVTEMLTPNISKTAKDDALKVKVPESLTEPVSFNKKLSEDESDIAAQKAHSETENAKVNKLQKQVADLKLAISDSDLKIKIAGEELETSKRQLSADKDVISSLKSEQPSNIFQENQRLKGQLQSDEKLVTLLHNKDVDLKDGKCLQFQKQLSTAEVSGKENKSMSGISQMESTLKLNEEAWSRHHIGSLNTKCMSSGDLKKSLNAELVIGDPHSEPKSVLKTNELNNRRPA